MNTSEGFFDLLIEIFIEVFNSFLDKKSKSNKFNKATTIFVMFLAFGTAIAVIVFLVIVLIEFFK